MAEDPTAFTATHCGNLMRLCAECAEEDPEFLSRMTPDQRRALPRMLTDFFLVIEAAVYDQSAAEAARGGNGNGKPARAPKPSVLQTRS